ncbi:uncharacterized protein LOC122713902 [Apis laboriosa]|uniref:uncharacterized protein LOC122713902 n=1 Tax=Apis laboriosa TaxID=183418 RepID=UPI001CC6DB7F|nr:uncharacterized protein LOC122713902 [Apis laboriosa]
MKIINYVCCILTFVCLMNVAHSEESQSKMEQQFLDVFTTDESLKMKRPFCNAFTGCGKKRNFHENPTDSQDLEINGNIRLPFSIYKALLRAATRNVNEYQLSGIPQTYLSGRMPLHKRIDIRSSSLE